MNRDDLVNEIFTTIYEVSSKQYANSATDSLMKKIDKYVEQRIVKARLEIMKNFKAI